jgi:hypothetical protein
MGVEQDRFRKILALAVDPGAYEGEAVAALRRAFEMVQRNPSLGDQPPPINPKPPPAPPNDASIAIKVTNVAGFWFHIFLNSISEEAYGLGLKSKIVCDPLVTQTPMTVEIRCDGPKKACDAFQAHLTWLIDYINSHPQPTK